MTDRTARFFLAPAAGYFRSPSTVRASFRTIDALQRAQARYLRAGIYTDAYEGDLRHGDPWSADEAYDRRRQAVRA